MLRSSGAMRSSVHRVALDQCVELLALALHALRQLAREGGGVAVQELLEGTAGHVGLIAGDHRGAPLLCAAHRL
jgi:hypothetical protein